MTFYRRVITLLLIIGVIFTASCPTVAATDHEFTYVINDTAAYLLKTVPVPQVGSSGGEWTIIGLARSGYNAPQSFYDNYYHQVTSLVKERDGVLHEKKYTEYSRVILALTAIGKDPTDVGGYNLLEPLGDYDKTVWQGINGSIFALLALDSGGYEIPVCKEAVTQATREMYINDILNKQLADGGFSLSGPNAEPDVTGMALQALAKYQDMPKVKSAVKNALACLSVMQDTNGGYQSWGSANLESTAQVLMALCELDIDVHDSRFVKNGFTLTDNLLGYYVKGSGFQHSSDGSGVGGMATEQAFYALVNLQLVTNGGYSLYRMNDAVVVNSSDDENSPAVGLSGKHPDVLAIPVTVNRISFEDTSGHRHQAAIEALASRGIIDGITASSFAPDRTMTRAEFATIVTRSLGLIPQLIDVFSDVPSRSWYAAYVGTAYSYGIVNGASPSAFSPELTITREEAATMVARAARLCGMDTNMEEREIDDVLAQFDDSTQISEWASSSLAFCCQNEILLQDDMEIKPGEEMERCEIADMLYRMLNAANLM